MFKGLLAAAFAIGLASSPAAYAQMNHTGDANTPMHHDDTMGHRDMRNDHMQSDRHDMGRHNGWRKHHRQCRTTWRHHHRVRVCR